jgi:hypothetical protein
LHPQVLFDAVQLGDLQSTRATTHLAVANLRSCLDRHGRASVDGRNVAGLAVITRTWGDRPTDVGTVSGLVNRRGQPCSITATLPWSPDFDLGQASGILNGPLRVWAATKDGRG